jgi:hypothetical protein
MSGSGIREFEDFRLRCAQIAAGTTRGGNCNH